MWLVLSRSKSPGLGCGCVCSTVGGEHEKSNSPTLVLLLSIAPGVSGIPWQLVSFDSASSELCPPVVSKIINIFKMFSALGEGSQLMLALEDAFCPGKNAHVSPQRASGKITGWE